VLIYLTLRKIDFAKSLELIKDADFSILLLVVPVYVSSYLLRAIRWRLLLMPIKKVSAGESFSYMMLGFFMNNILPLRIGEVIRAKVSGERLGISRSSALATIIVERLFDIITFILLFFAIMFFMPFPMAIRKTFFICAVVFGLVAVAFFIIALNERKFSGIIAKLPMPQKIKGFVYNFVEKFASGLKVLKNSRIISANFLLSAAIWLAEGMVFVIVAYAFGINLNLMGGIFTTIIIGVSAIIPTAPGHIGAYEFMGTTALSALGHPVEAAFAVVATTHFLQMSLIFTLGFIGMLKEKISMKDIFNFTKNIDNN